VNWKGTARGPGEEFEEINATRAAGGTLDEDTRLAGTRTLNMIKALSAMLLTSRTRSGEEVQVIAHSHGTAMLLSAAIQNHGDFRLRSALLVGSDLYPFMSLEPLLRSASIVYNFFSGGDWITGSVAAAGHYGFRDRKLTLRAIDPTSAGPERYRLRPDTETFKQIPVSGVAHVQSEDKIPGHASTAWMSYQMGLTRYGEKTAIKTRRRGGESEPWIDQYKKLRLQMGVIGQWTPDLPPMYRQAYTPK